MLMIYVLIVLFSNFFVYLGGYMIEECGEIVFWMLWKKFVVSSDEMLEYSF